MRQTPDNSVVTVGAGIGTQPDHLFDKPEPRLEHVLRDHRCAVGDRRQGDRHRLQVGRKSRERQRCDVDSLWPLVLAIRKLLSVCVTVAPASCSLCSTTCRCAGSTPVTVMSPRVMAAAIPHVAATMRSPMTRCSVGYSRATPAIGHGRRTRAFDLGAHLVQHHAEIDHVGFACRIVIVVTPSARTAAIRMFSVAPTDGNSN